MMSQFESLMAADDREVVLLSCAGSEQEWLYREQFGTFAQLISASLASAT